MEDGGEESTLLRRLNEKKRKERAEERGSWVVERDILFHYTCKVKTSEELDTGGMGDIKGCGGHLFCQERRKRIRKSLNEWFSH